MNEEEFKELVQFTKEMMIERGLSDLADDRNYLIPNLTDEAAPQLYPPEKHLHLLLENFQNHLRLIDENTVLAGLKRIGYRVSSGPKRAEIQFPQPNTIEPESFNLLRLPDTSALRRSIRILVNNTKNIKNSDEERFLE